MIESHKLEMLDETIKHCMLAKQGLHKDPNIFTKEVVLAYGCINAVKESIKEDFGTITQVIKLPQDLKIDTEYHHIHVYDQILTNYNINPPTITYLCKCGKNAYA